MKKVCRSLAEYIGRSIDVDNERIDVIAYGLIAIFQFIVIFIVSFLIAIYFGCSIEATIIFLSVGFFRRVIGGAHSSGINSCIVISILFIDLFSLLSRFVLFEHIKSIYIYIGLSIIYILSFILVYKLAPIDNPNKPIRNLNKRRKLRIQAFIVLFVFMLLTIVLILLQCSLKEHYLSYAMSLGLSVLWQSIMLTKIGHSFIKAIDKLFGLIRFNKQKRRT